MSYNCRTNIIIGQRRNGKTYEVKSKFLDFYKEDNEWYFIYVRRTQSQVASTKVSTLFSDMKEKCIEAFGSEQKYSSIKGFYFINKDGEEKIFGKTVSLEKAMDIKGMTFPEKCFIYFDEFIDDMYFKDEVRRYLNVIKTITSNSDKCIIFLTANTISKYCPYFKLFGVDIQKLKKGCIGVVRHRNGATIAIERTRTKVDDEIDIKNNDKYVGFDDDETVKMMLYGDWQNNNECIKNIDGISWSYKYRSLVPVYLTSLKNVYEISLTKENKYPITFVRKINTQNGIVRNDIKINLSHDDTVILQTNSGKIIPKFNRISKLFFDENIYRKLCIVSECIKVGRVIFDTIETGTEFKQAYEEIM